MCGSIFKSWEQGHWGVLFSSSLCLLVPRNCLTRKAECKYFAKQPREETYPGRAALCWALAMDTMLNEGHYLGREGCLFRCGSVPEPGATRLATLAAIQKSLLALSRLCGYAMLGQEVNSPRTEGKPCSFLPQHVHLKMLQTEGFSVCKKYSGPEPAGLFQRV